jgi:hypothetical protein
MSQQQGNFQSPYRPNISDNRDLSLWVKNTQGKFAGFKFRVAGNKIRMSVYPNIEGDNKAINGILTPIRAYGFLEIVKKAINTPADGNDHTYKMTVNRPGSDGNKMVTDFELYAGRNKEGLVWISLFRYDRPKIAFTFSDDKWHQYVFTTGEQATPAEVSSLIASAWVNMMTNLAATLLVTEFVEEDNSGRKGGNRNNNGYRNDNRNDQGNYNNDRNEPAGGSSHGYDANGSSYDDDVPY